MSYWSCSYAELQGPKGKRQKKSKNIYFKHRCLTWKFITKHESTQLIVMCVAQPLLLTGRCLCCPMRVRYPFHFFLYFFSTESPTSLQCKIRKKIIGNLPIRVLDLKEPEKIRCHWNKKKVKGFGSWLLRYQKKKKYWAWLDLVPL
jgi:hypothetical protein